MEIKVAALCFMLTIVMAIPRQHQPTNVAPSPETGLPSPKPPDISGIGAGEYHQIGSVSSQYNSVIAETQVKKIKANGTGLHVAGVRAMINKVEKTNTANILLEAMPSNIRIGIDIGAPFASQYREDDMNLINITDDQNLQVFTPRAFPEVNTFLSLTQPVTYYEPTYSGMVNSQDVVTGVTPARGKKAKREVMPLLAKESGPVVANSVYDVMVSWKLHKAESTKTLNVVFEKAPEADFLWTLQTFGLPVSHWVDQVTKDQVPGALWGMAGCLKGANYNRPAAYILAGSRTWILKDALPKILALFNRNVLKIETTRILCIVLDSSGETTESRHVWRGKLQTQLPELANLILLERVTVLRSAHDSQNSQVSPTIKPLRSFGKRMTVESHTKPASESSSSRHTLTFDIRSSKSNGDGFLVFEYVGSWCTHLGLKIEASLASPLVTDFRGRDLILTTIHKPQVFELIAANGKVATSLDQVGGYVPVLLGILKKRYNFTYVLTVSTEFGSLVNGTWTGMCGVLVDKKAHLSPLDYSVPPSRLAAMDYSEWYSTDPIILVSQAPAVVIPPFLLLQIFTVPVWLCLLATSLLSGLALYLIERPLNEFNRSHEPRQPTLLGTMASALLIFVLQGTTQCPRGSAGRVLLAGVLFMVISVYAFYQGNITAFLAVPRRSKPIDSAEELVKRLDTVTPIARENTIYWPFLANFPTTSPIYDKIKLFTDDYLNTWDFFKNIHAGKYSLIDTLSSGAGRAANLETHGEQCRFYISRNQLRLDLDAMVHRRNSIYRTPIDNAFRHLKYFGIAEWVKQKFYKAPCERGVKLSINKPFSLDQVQSALYVLCVGWVAGVIVFLVELTFYKINSRGSHG